MNSRFARAFLQFVLTRFPIRATPEYYALLEFSALQIYHIVFGCVPWAPCLALQGTLNLGEKAQKLFLTEGKVLEIEHRVPDAPKKKHWSSIQRP